MYAMARRGVTEADEYGVLARWLDAQQQINATHKGWLVLWSDSMCKLSEERLHFDLEVQQGLLRVMSAQGATVASIVCIANRND